MEWRYESNEILKNKGCDKVVEVMFVQQSSLFCLIFFFFFDCSKTFLFRPEHYNQFSFNGIQYNWWIQMTFDLLCKLQSDHWIIIKKRNKILRFLTKSQKCEIKQLNRIRQRLQRFFRCVLKELDKYTFLQYRNVDLKCEQTCYGQTT